MRVTWPWKSAMLLALAVSCGGISAQTYPARTVKVVVPFPAGTTTDIAGRTMVDALRQQLGGVWIVENKPGQAGVIGTEVLKREAPDGYSLLLTTGAHFSTAPWLYKNFPYDPVKDFTHIARLNLLQYAVVVPVEMPVATLQEFVTHAKSKRGSNSLTYGFGSSSAQFAAMSLASTASFEALGVPYKGNNQAITDLLGGRVQFMTADVSLAVPYVKAGKLRALAVTSSKRSEMLSEVPTVSEAGLGGYEFSTWIGLAGPAGMPGDIVDRLNAALRQSMARKENLDRFTTMGLEVSVNSPVEQREYVREQLARQKNYVDSAGIKPE